MVRTHDLPGARGGFTLVELIAVVVLLTILSATVVWSLSGHVHHSRLVQAADRVESLDRRARDEARRSAQSVRLVWDERERNAQIEPANAGQLVPALHQMRMGKHVELEVILPGQQRGGSKAVYVSPNGQSASYAVGLTAPNDAQLWVVTLGLSGQQLRFETEEDAHAVLGL